MKVAVFFAGVLFVIATSLGFAQEAATNPLAGKRFVSLEKLTGGDRPDGKINKIHWTVKFDSKSFQWLRTDVIIRGAYEYDAKTGSVKTDSGKVSGTFDSKTGILTWGSHKYTAEKESK